jgi:hypothetical protein
MNFENLNNYKQEPAFSGGESKAVYTLPERPKFNAISSRGTSVGSGAPAEPMVQSSGEGFQTGLEESSEIGGGGGGGGGGELNLIKKSVYICENGEPAEYEFVIDASLS